MKLPLFAKTADGKWVRLNPVLNRHGKWIIPGLCFCPQCADPYFDGYVGNDITTPLLPHRDKFEKVADENGQFPLKVEHE